MKTSKKLNKKRLVLFMILVIYQLFSIIAIANHDIQRLLQFLMESILYIITGTTIIIMLSTIKFRDITDLFRN